MHIWAIVMIWQQKLIQDCFTQPYFSEFKKHFSEGLLHSVANIPEYKMEGRVYFYTIKILLVTLLLCIHHYYYNH